MLLHKETFEKYNYYPESLPNNSLNEICFRCDYCQTIANRKYKSYILGTESLVKKDTCVKCKGKKQLDCKIIKNNNDKEYFKTIQNKREETNLKNFGNKSFFGSEKGIKTVKDIMLNKYGEENISKIDFIKKKKSDTCLKNFGVTNPSFSNGVREKRIETKKENGKMHIINGKTLAELSKTYNVSNATIYRAWKDGNWNPENEDWDFKKRTDIENVLYQILKENQLSFEFNKNLKTRKYDFLLKDYKLIIEVNGLYWHSELRIKNKFYHSEKMNFYKKEGYDSLFFHQDEVLNKTKVIESIIINKINNSKEENFYEKGFIKEISNKEATDFFENNHLNGYIESKSYGFVIKDEIMFGIQFEIKEKSLEILRIAKNKNFNLETKEIFGKLLDEISNIYKPTNVILNVDLRFESYDFLHDIGFKEQSTDVSFKWTNCKTTYFKSEFSKDEAEIKKLSRIYDCGNIVYKKEYLDK